jgi:hypothetical protein
MILIWKPSIIIISSKIRSIIISPDSLFKALFITRIPRLIINKAEDPALIFLLIITLINILNSNKSLLFIKYITL